MADDARSMLFIDENFHYPSPCLTLHSTYTKNDVYIHSHHPCKKTLVLVVASFILWRFFNRKNLGRAGASMTATTTTPMMMMMMMKLLLNCNSNINNGTSSSSNSSGR